MRGVWFMGLLVILGITAFLVFILKDDTKTKASSKSKAFSDKEQQDDFDNWYNNINNHR
jgi:hypothetical protein